MAEKRQKLGPRPVELLIPPTAKARRIDAVLCELLSGVGSEGVPQASVSRTLVQELLQSGALLVDGQNRSASYRLKGGERVVGELPTSLKPSDLTPVPLPLSIIFEDESLIVIDKPAGLTVHPGAGTMGQATLVQALLHHCQMVPPGHDPERPGIVHRLDRDTSGLIVCAKSRPALASLSEQFRNKSAGRIYIALIDGVLPQPHMTVESYLYRDPEFRLRFASLADREFQSSSEKRRRGCRFARSHFKLLANFGHVFAKVAVKLDTGRTHQIRVHARDLGAPILGDKVYGRRRDYSQTIGKDLRETIAGLSRQMLHAAELTFVHPESGEACAFSSPLPDDMALVSAALSALRVE